MATEVKSAVTWAKCFGEVVFEVFVDIARFGSAWKNATLWSKNRVFLKKTLENPSKPQVLAFLSPVSFLVQAWKKDQQGLARLGRARNIEGQQGLKGSKES